MSEALPKVEVRAGTPADLDQMLPLLEGLFSVEADFVFDAAKQRRGLIMLMEQGRDGQVLVADNGGLIVGMCTVQVLVSTAEGGAVGLVEDVVVLPGFRRQGVGRCLLEALEDWCARRGLSRLQLLADRDNVPALDFYRRLGWETTRLVGLRRRKGEVPGFRYPRD